MTEENAEQSIAINGRKIGSNHPTYIIAEMSCNHAGDLEVALEIVRAAKAAGADAIKLQTYTPDTITIDCDNEYFQIGSGTLWDGQTLHQLYAKAYTPWAWHSKIKKLADDLALDCFSSPFDHTAVDFLEDLGTPAYKIASFEIVDLPLLRRVAETGKPVILSTGMASLEEIQEAVDTLRAAGARELAILKCTSAYPADPADMHLRTIPNLSETFGLVAGLSDHTLGITVPVVAAALGARIIEKHFTLSRSVEGPDSAFSLEPAEFSEMVQAVRTAERALGEVQYGAKEGEKGSLLFRRSLFVVQNIKAGEPFTLENVRSIRPSNGLHTRHLEEVIGRSATRDIERGTPLSRNLIG